MSEEPLPEELPEKKRDNTVFLLIVVMLLIVGIVVLWVVKDSEVYRTTVPVCTSENVAIDLSEPETPSVFSDLTQKEMTNVLKLLYLRPDLNLLNDSTVSVDSCYLYSMELHLPKKSEALHYLDKNKTKPSRYAKAILFRGDLDTPRVEEYVIGPLSNFGITSIITVVQLTKTVPFALRPISAVELRAIEKNILTVVDLKAGQILVDAFGAKFLNCTERCLTYSVSPGPRLNLPSIRSFPHKVTRNLWLHFAHAVEYYSLHPLEFDILVNVDGTDTTKYQIVEIWYNKQMFANLDEFVNKFVRGKLQKLHIQFPEVNKNLFSTLNLRGVPFPREPSRRPFQLEPDGKRYSVNGQQIRYIGWSFDYRMSTTSGPMLFDVKYRGDRIAYEISLQEIAVLSEGKIPSNQFNRFETMSGLLGAASKGLVPGADCPEHATFLPARHLMEGSNTPLVYPNALCVFEQETGIPLRRHHSYNTNGGKFFGGMLDDILVLRTVLAVDNYDYIIDFVFHLNGVLEVKVFCTGYTVASYTFNHDSHNGYQIHEKLVGHIHHHHLNFRVDLDIRGKRNRFETLESAPTVASSLENSTSQYSNLERNLKRSENEATFLHDANRPKYLLFYNERATNKYKVPRAYRIQLSEAHQPIIPLRIDNKESVSWIPYKLAVTKYKADESRSSSPYSKWDSSSPVVKFSNFLSDNEIIEDQDLVAWVNLAYYHVPHTEDLPNMATVGGHLTFFLIPHNYYKEDPSMSSRNAIRVDMSGTSKSSNLTARVERYSVPNNVRCVGNATDFYDLVAEDSKLLFVGDES